MRGEEVLVTGGSGFVGAHCIVQLLEAGYRVRTTVRSLKRERNVRAMVQAGGQEPADALRFAEADLMSDTGWVKAVAGCRYVLHVASPFPLSNPKDEDELIVPAREGTLRVLRAARDGGVERVVLTSSSVAITEGHPQQEALFDETDWTDLSGKGMTAYAKSKTLAERAAWAFLAEEGGSLELAVVNPVGIFGPVLGPDYASSVVLIQRFLEGSVPGCPRISFGTVDVRDVADLHLRAMAHPAARGERFLAVAGENLYALDVAKILKQRLGVSARRVSTRELPDWVVRAVAFFNSDVRLIVPELGKVKQTTNAKAKRLLGWAPRSNEECLVATAESLVRLGLLKGMQPSSAAG